MRLLCNLFFFIIFLFLNLTNLSADDFTECVERERQLEKERFSNGEVQGYSEKKINEICREKFKKPLFSIGIEAEYIYADINFVPCNRSSTGRGSPQTNFFYHGIVPTLLFEVVIPYEGMITIKYSPPANFVGGKRKKKYTYGEDKYFHYDSINREAWSFEPKTFFFSSPFFFGLYVESFKYKLNLSTNDERVKYSEIPISGSFFGVNAGYSGEDFEFKVHWGVSILDLFRRKRSASEIDYYWLFTDNDEIELIQGSFTTFSAVGVSLNVKYTF